MDTRKLSYYSLEPHLFNLRALGYYQIDPKSPKLQRLLHKIFMRLTLILITVYTIQQAARVIQVRDDIDKVIGTMFLFLTHTDSIYKQIIMWIRADQIEELLETMRGSLYNQDEIDHREPLIRRARHQKFLLRMNNILAVLTCLLWVLYPLILHIQGKHIEFAIWLPFDVNANPEFYLSAIYVWVVTSWLAIGNTTMDVMVASMLAQCQTQLFIMRNNLTKLVQRGEEETKALIEKTHCSNFTFENIIFKRFETVIKHHREIVKYAKKVEDIFGCAIAYQFLASAWIICTSVYKMVQLQQGCFSCRDVSHSFASLFSYVVKERFSLKIDPLSLQFLSMIMYVICMLLQLFLYCYYGSQVTHESEMLTYSAYAVDWLKIPIKHRRYLITFMERLKVPILPLAGFIIPLSNNTFVSIVKSSYTFYAILKNSSE